MDAQVAPFAHRIGIAALERLVAEAIARFMPDRAAEDAAKAADGRHFTIEHQQVSFNGTSQISGELDLADALDLDAAVAQGAETLRALGVDRVPRRTPLPGRRPDRPQPARPRPRRAAGEAAATPGWSSSERSERTDETTTPNKGTKPRQVVLYVHLSEAAITGTSGSLELARVENQRQVVTADQIRTWCANPDAQVVVKPVIDLNEHIHVEGYEVPARLREQTVLRDHTCVFPWCTRSARKADADHVIPYAEGGTTSSDNIAPLCRRHHRLKTHSTLDLHDARTRIVPVVEPARLPVPPRPPRHPRRQPRPATARGRIRRTGSCPLPAVPALGGAQACAHVTATGLVCPLASLAARPPVVAAAPGVRTWFRLPLASLAA